jgi:leucyl aminopeptidase
MNFFFNSLSLTTIPAQGYVLFLEDEFDISKLNEVQSLYPPIEQIIKRCKFTGKAETHLLITGIHNNESVYIILLGLGKFKNNSLDIENYRLALGSLIRIMETHNVYKVSINIPNPIHFCISYMRLAQETSMIILKASYQLDQFMTNPNNKFNHLYEFYVHAHKEIESEIKIGLKQGICIGNAINKTRYWCELPPSKLTPAIFAQQAQEIANLLNLKITIFDQDAIFKMGMEGLEGVSRGSTNECKLIVLEYKAKKPDAITLVLVGKGITFDSGGLNLKSSAVMHIMKHDMAGAAVSLAAIQVIAELKPDINVIVIIPAAENMPSGSALKSGDVIRLYNGSTAEVKDTDAEGRLVLADALAYASKNYNPDFIIDVATISLATANALGTFYCGLFSQHDTLTTKIKKASQLSGDGVWQLPMDDRYKKAIHSDIADICNVDDPKYMASGIAVAFFLQQFVGDIPWAHLDITGTSLWVPDKSYLRHGASGFGTRLLIDLIMNWNQL